MKNSKKIIVLSLLLIVIMATLSSCEVGGMTIKIPGWEAFKEKFGPHEHSMKLVAEVPATCYFEGAEAHYSCEKCNQLFADEAGNTPIEAPKAIPMVAHTEQVVTGKPSTCTETGLTDGTKCSVCNEILKEQSVIGFKDHTEETVAGVPAGCTNNGLSEGKKCSVCGTITLSQHIVYATGHKYDNDQDLSCNVCDNFRCLHNNREEAGEAVKPTCKDEGLTAGVKCSDCGIILEEQKPVEKLEHTVAIDSAVAPGCIEEGLTEGKHCSVCGEVLKAQESVAALGHTFDNEQDTDCNVCGEPRCFHEDTEAIGEAKDATCKEEGITAGVKCSDCGMVLEAQKPIEKADHTVVIDNAVSAECFKPGLTEGKHCSVCGEVIQAQESTDPLGAHNWDGVNCTGCNATKLEAETADIESDIDRLGAGMQDGKTPETTNHPSGDGYVYYLSDSGNAKLTFYVNSDKAGKAILSFCFGLSNEYKASDLFTVEVNGVAVELYENAIIPKYDSVDAVKYFGWYEVEVADIDLIAGDNVITLTKATKGLNFDYISVRSDNGASFKDSREKDGHSYAGWDVITTPTYAEKGKIGAYCEYCRDYSTAELPVVSTQNGYTKISSGIKDVWTYTHKGETLEIELFGESQTYTFAVVDESNPFTSVVDGNGETNGVNGINTNKYGTFYEKTKGATFTITVNVEEATDISFIVNVCSTNNYSFDYSKAITSVTSSSSSGSNKVVVNSGTVDTVGWYTNDASAIEIATISLAKGVNTISFTMGTDTAKDLNVASVEIVSFTKVVLETK